MSKFFLAFLTTAGFLAACSDAGDDDGTLPPPDDVAAVEVEPSGNELGVGDQLQLTARAFDAAGDVIVGQRFRWESADVAVATVGPDGMVTAIAPGEVTIYASAGLVSGGTFLIVSDDAPAPVAWIELSPSAEVQLDAGSTLQLGATAYDADGQVLLGRAFTWSSDATAVATVSDAGLVAALATGNAWIAVECEGQRDELLVRVPDVVDPPVTVDHITIDYTELVLPVGDTFQLTAQPRDANGAPLDREVTWSSNNPEYVSVDANGLVTALQVGGADITATSEGRSTSVLVYAHFTTSYTLVGLDGAALPATFGPVAEGVGVRVYDGYLVIDHNSWTYEVVVRGVYTTITPSWVPVPINYESYGEVTINAATGVHTFTPQLGRAFTGRRNPTGFEVDWQIDDRYPHESTFSFRLD